MMELITPNSPPVIKHILTIGQIPGLGLLITIQANIVMPNIRMIKQIGNRYLSLLDRTSTFFLRKETSRNRIRQINTTSITGYSLRRYEIDSTIMESYHTCSITSP